jgi:hypothetical protein
MQRSFYIFVIEKFGLSNSHYPNRVLITIDFVTRHAQSYFYSFICIMYVILYSILLKIDIMK